MNLTPSRSNSIGWWQPSDKFWQAANRVNQRTSQNLEQFGSAPKDLLSLVSQRYSGRFRPPLSTEGAGSGIVPIVMTLCLNEGRRGDVNLLGMRRSAPVLVFHLRGMWRQRREPDVCTRGDGKGRKKLLAWFSGAIQQSISQQAA
jgi:hypothetical protein